MLKLGFLFGTPPLDADYVKVYSLSNIDLKLAT
jgi:hypothetical protein